MKWWRRWQERRRYPLITVEPQRHTEMNEESWYQEAVVRFTRYPDLERSGSPWADQRARFLKERNEGKMTMGQYHSAVDISRLAEADMITHQEAVVRFTRLFSLKELD